LDAGIQDEHGITQHITITLPALSCVYKLTLLLLQSFTVKSGAIWENPILHNTIKREIIVNFFILLSFLN
jgi:hypothetical protein